MNKNPNKRYIFKSSSGKKPQSGNKNGPVGFSNDLVAIKKIINVIKANIDIKIKI
jgi:hypothetical protein